MTRPDNPQIDFTLHTILEESCEDSDPESRRGSDSSSNPVSPSGRHHHRHARGQRHSGPSEMERYFLYGVGGHADGVPASPPPVTSR